MQANSFNGALDGCFTLNLNNAPSNVNTNIGFRCCKQFPKKRGAATKPCRIAVLHGGLHRALYGNYTRPGPGPKGRIRKTARAGFLRPALATPALTMKTYTNLMEKVCAYGNLLLAYQKASKGKRGRPEVAAFFYGLEPSLLGLRESLLDGTWTPGQYRTFTIYEPKKRTIMAAPFGDRVVHHAICNIIEPIFDGTFIYDSCACRTDKGTHFGVGRLQRFIRALPESGNYYALKCDIRNYFGSINHGILMGILAKKIRDEKLLELLRRIVSSTPGQKGIPIGNLTSQLFANIYLNELDYFAKHALRAKYYVRYMDDFVLLGQKEELNAVKAGIAEFLAGQLDLELHPHKANVFPVRCGVDFCGYSVFRSHRRLRAASVRRFARKLRSMKKSKLPQDAVRKSVESWLAHAKHADTFGLQRKLLGG